MSEYENFERIIKGKGITAYRVAKETGITTATLTSWKQGKYTPKMDKLQKIADYLGVTLGELTAEWEAATPAEIAAFEKNAATPYPITDQERKLLEVFHKLSADQQEEVLRYGQFLYEKFHDERKKTSVSSKEA